MTLEERLDTPIKTTIQGHEETIYVGGIIDRLDIVMDNDGCETLRVLDYKTGRYDNKKLSVKDMATLFDNRLQKNTHDSDYLRQTLIYCLACQHEQPEASQAVTETLKKGLPVKPALLFVREVARKGHQDMNLKIAKQPIVNYCLHDDGKLKTAQEEWLKKLVEEIVTATDFPACEEGSCNTFCPFFQLCNRKKSEW